MGGPKGEGLYTFHNVVGQGAFAKVYRATKKGSEENFAAKVTFLARVPAGFLGRIKEEARILSQVKHAHVIQFYKFSLAPNNKRAVLIMGFADGGSLEKFTTGDAKLSEPQIVQVLQCVSKALGFLHKRHITHCDLKPDNILVMRPGDYSTVRIADFGISQQSKLRLKIPCGTPRYCAPEIFKEPCRFGPPVDIWALGVITVQFVMGVHPFPELSGKNFEDIYHKPQLLIKVQNFSLDPATHPMAMKCTPEVFSVAQRMLQVDVKDRITAKSLLKAAIFSDSFMAEMRASAGSQSDSAIVVPDAVEKAAGSLDQQVDAPRQAAASSKKQSAQKSSKSKLQPLQSQSSKQQSKSKQLRGPTSPHSRSSKKLSAHNVDKPVASTQATAVAADDNVITAHQSSSSRKTVRESKLASSTQKQNREHKVATAARQTSNGRNEAKTNGVPYDPPVVTPKKHVALTQTQHVSDDKPSLDKPVPSTLDEQLLASVPLHGSTVGSAVHHRSKSDSPQRSPVAAHHSRSLSASPVPSSDAFGTDSVSLPAINTAKPSSTAPPIMAGTRDRGGSGQITMRNPSPGLDLLQKAIDSPSSTASPGSRAIPDLKSFKQLWKSDQSFAVSSERRMDRLSSGPRARAESATFRARADSASKRSLNLQLSPSGSSRKVLGSKHSSRSLLGESSAVLQVSRGGTKQSTGSELRLRKASSSPLESKKDGVPVEEQHTSGGDSSKSVQLRTLRHARWSRRVRRRKLLKKMGSSSGAQPIDVDGSDEDSDLSASIAATSRENSIKFTRLDSASKGLSLGPSMRRMSSSNLLNKSSRSFPSADAADRHHDGETHQQDVLRRVHEAAQKQRDRIEKRKKRLQKKISSRALLRVSSQQSTSTGTGSRSSLAPPINSTTTSI